jgi:hypothetical protein
LIEAIQNYLKDNFILDNKEYNQRVILQYPMQRRMRELTANKMRQKAIQNLWLDQKSMDLTKYGRKEKTMGEGGKYLQANKITLSICRIIKFVSLLSPQV